MFETFLLRDGVFYCILCISSGGEGVRSRERYPKRVDRGLETNFSSSRNGRNLSAFWHAGSVTSHLTTCALRISEEGGVAGSVCNFYPQRVSLLVLLTATDSL